MGAGIEFAAGLSLPGSPPQPVSTATAAARIKTTKTFISDFLYSLGYNNNSAFSNPAGHRDSIVAIWLPPLSIIQSLPYDDKVWPKSVQSRHYWLSD
jgi:hypothetical protein